MNTLTARQYFREIDRIKASNSWIDSDKLDIDCFPGHIHLVKEFLSEFKEKFSEEAIKSIISIHFSDTVKVVAKLGGTIVGGAMPTIAASGRMVYVSSRNCEVVKNLVSAYENGNSCFCKVCGISNVFSIHRASKIVCDEHFDVENYSIPLHILRNESEDGSFKNENSFSKKLKRSVTSEKKYKEVMSELFENNSFAKNKVVVSNFLPGHLCFVDQFLKRIELVFSSSAFDDIEYISINGLNKEIVIFQEGEKAVSVKDGFDVREKISIIHHFWRIISAKIDSRVVCGACGDNTGYCSCKLGYFFGDTSGVSPGTFFQLVKEEKMFEKAAAFMSDPIPDGTEMTLQNFTGGRIFLSGNEHKITKELESLLSDSSGIINTPDNEITVKFYDQDALDALISRIDSDGNKQSERLRRALGDLNAPYQSTRFLANQPSDWKSILDQFIARYPNFSEVHQFLMGCFSLQSIGDNTVHIPPMMLLGDPGIGKTSASSWLANKLGVRFRKVDLSTSSSASTLAGVDRYWSSAAPGIVFETLASEKYINPIILLDEIDKALSNHNGDPLAPFYGLLVKESAKDFTDCFIRDMTIDASHISWIASANSIQAIPEPILSRFTVFSVPSPTNEQKRHIIQNIYNDVIASNTWGMYFEKTLKDDVINLFLECPNPRVIESVMMRSLGVAAYDNKTVMSVEAVSAVANWAQKRSIGFH